MKAKNLPGLLLHICILEAINEATLYIFPETDTEECVKFKICDFTAASITPLGEHFGCLRCYGDGV